MNREQYLDAARACVLKNRQDIYGPPEDGFALIAALWSAYTGHTLESYDVAAMMILLKVARIAANPRHEDSWTDAVGYAACGGELATGPREQDVFEDPGEVIGSPQDGLLTATAQAQGVHRPRLNGPLWRP